MSRLTLGKSVHQNALFLANACSASYAKRPAQTAAFKRTDLDRCVTFDDGDPSGEGDGGFVATSPDGTVVALRGTNDLADWLSNLNFDLVPSHGGKVHEGFLSGAQKMEAIIADTIKELAPGKGPLYLAGHSRGAAIGILLADGLCERLKQKRSNLGIYGFGSPRVGDEDFYHHYQLRSRTHLYVNNADPVVLSPPKDLGFIHVARQTLIVNQELSEIDVDVPLNYFEHLFRLTFSRSRFKDHSLEDGYIKNMELAI